MSLSVLMANYNHGRYLRQSLGAILAQGECADEIIFVDDGSTDDSVAIARSMGRDCARLRIIERGTNRGMVASFQTALEVSRGSYIYFASADDMLLPNFFTRSLRLLAQHPEAGLCCAFHSTMDGSTGAIDRNPTWLRESPGYLSPRELAGRLLNGGIPGHTTILRRDAFLAAGGYRPELRWHCDWFVSLVLAFRHGICFMPESVALNRVYSSSYSASGRRDRRAQRKVLGHMLQLLLQPMCEDVLPLFQRSRVLAALQPELGQAAGELGLEHDPRVAPLLQRCRWHDEVAWQWRSQRLKQPVARWLCKALCHTLARRW